MMNPKWNGHSIVKYLADWLPTHLEYTGPVLNMPLVYINVPALPSPDSPVFEELTFADSTVQIEEVDEAMAEMKAVLAAGPQEEEDAEAASMAEDAMHRRLEKRRRV
jgi:hypothetical protein